MRIVKGFCRYVNTMNDWAGRAVCLLIVIMTLITTFEVIARYIFNKPTIWAWDINIQLMAVVVALGAGYTLLYKGHVIVDVLVERFPRRVRAIIDLVTSGFFFLSMVILIDRAILKAADSISIHEMLSTVWGPPLYPLRVIIPIGFIMFALQGVVKFINDLTVVVSGKEAK